MRQFFRVILGKIGGNQSAAPTVQSCLGLQSPRLRINVMLMNHTPPGWFALARHVGELIDNNGGQRECERATLIDQSTLSRKINGRSPFNVAELDLIAEWLGTTSAQIIEEAQTEVRA